MDCGLENLASRIGPRPEVRPGIPHIQLNQWPSQQYVDTMARMALSLPHVRQKESQLANASVRALWIPHEFARGAPEAFICAHEFCHLHPSPSGGLHITLNGRDRERAVSLQWAEKHPLAGYGFLPPSLVLVYAPRDEHELGQVMLLIRSSLCFALGKAVSGAMEPE